MGGARVQVSSWCLAEIKNWPKPTYRIWTKPCKNYGISDLQKIYGPRIHKVQTLTTKDCRGPQTNMPKNVGSIKTWPAKMKSRHLDSCPLRRHVVWRDSVGVGSSRSELKSECADIFHQSFLWLLGLLTSPKEAEKAVYGYNPALFWVLSVSCRCLAESIFTQYDQHCSILLAKFLNFAKYVYFSFLLIRSL